MNKWVTRGKNILKCGGTKLDKSLLAFENDHRSVTKGTCLEKKW